MLKKLKSYIPKGAFAKNVLTLMTGTAIAQAIPIAISPILTRIYTPDDFGVLALFLSITSILSVIITGRYEFAITLPKEKKDALQLVYLSIIITLLISVFLLIIVLLFSEELTNLLGNPNIKYWLYFVPLTVFLSGIYQTFNYWFNRNKNYLLLSKSRVLQTTTSSSVNLGVGLITKGNVGGLVFGNILSRLLTSIYFLFIFLKNNTIKLDKFRIKHLSKKYINFPKYDMPASFFNIASNQSTHIFFNLFFDSISSGYFYLTQRIFTLPISLIAGSIQEVFKMEIITIHLNNGNTRRLFVKTLKNLTLLAIIPSILIYLFAIDVFAFVFGAEWKPAGEFVKIMTPVFFLRFVSFPLSYMVYVVEKQIYNTIIQFVSFLGILISFYIGKNYDVNTTVFFITIVYSLFYLSYLGISYSLTSKGSEE